MERDFMGLNSKDSEIDIEEEVVERGCKDSEPARGSGFPISWQSSNNISALPNFMSLKSEHDEKLSLVKSTLRGYVVKSGAGIFEAKYNRQPVDIQNYGNTSMRPQFLGGNPYLMLPSTASVSRTTNRWINSNASDVSDQLTIFYAGMVNVFDDISPEKAQAIMLLAGHSRVPRNMVLSKLQVPAPKSKPPCGNHVLANHPCSGLQSPVSVSSHPINQSGGMAAKNENDNMVTAFSMSTSPLNKVERPRMVSSIGSVTAIISSSVPQSRKASLAQFLKKRNERASSAALYNLVKREIECPQCSGI